MAITVITLLKALSHLLNNVLAVTWQVIRGFLKYGLKYQIN